MKNILLLIIAVFALGLFVAGCSTTTKTTYYNADGTINRVEEVSEISDANALASYLQQGDAGNATDRSLDITKFSLGYADIGLSWLSIGGNSTKAPATSVGSDATLKGMAEVKKAGKTTIQTADIGVNGEVSKAELATEANL